MLRKLGGLWLGLVLSLAFVLGASGLAIAAPDSGTPSTISDSVPDDSSTGGSDASDSDVDPDPEPDPEPDPDPETHVVTATVSADEKVVRLVANDPSLADAERVVFRVWPKGDGKALIEHEAVQLDDGSWVATAYIASNTFDDPGVPYSCRVLDAVHRLYNPYSNQHLFTLSASEADGLSRSGWHYEGVAWVQPHEVEEPEGPTAPEEPTAGDASEEFEKPADPATPAVPGESDEPSESVDATDSNAGTDAGTRTGEAVYRLYNPYSGDHFYTMNKAEYDALPASGWRQEDVAFRSDPERGVAVYRVYNPYVTAGAHHFTTSEHEYRTLLSNGWRDEGVAWYGDDLNADGTWCARAQNRFHDVAGDYEVEAVATMAAPDVPGTGDDAANPPVADPTDTTEASDPAKPSEPSEPSKPSKSEETIVGTATFAVTQPTATARIENVDNAHGTYDVVVSGASSVSGIAHVYVPTWTDNGGQDDIVWYEASRQGDGSYRATVSIARHSFEHEFTSHVYLKAGNGVMANVAQLSQYLTLANYLRMSGGPYTYTVSIYNPGVVSRVQMPTWSEQGGQDDLVWFDAHDEGNGWWTTTVDVTRLTSSGTVHTHVYADGQFRGAVPDYTIQPWEILAWRYRNMNDRIRGLASPTGWLLAVDTSNCFVGVYQGSQGNWRNNVWWDCAPGTAATPTVKGVFHVGSRGYSFGHGYTCYYWTQFYGDYLFHSIKYYEGTFNPMDPTLGRPASLGCVRLAIANAKWIHDTIPSGTTVLVY